MKYIALVYTDNNLLSAVPQQEFNATMRDCLEKADSMKQKGQVLDFQQLESTSTAKSMRVRNGKRLVTDGPFAETREQLGGYYLIDARDLDEAMNIAERIPVAKHGTIEIRPVLEIAGLPGQ